MEERAFLQLSVRETAAILAAQPKRDTGGVQVMPRSVEVDGPEFLCCGRADAEVADGNLASEPIHVGFAQLDLELQFLHEPSPDNAFFPFPLAAREDRCDKRMTACFISPARSVTCNYAFDAQSRGSGVRIGEKSCSMRVAVGMSTQPSSPPTRA